VHYHAQLPSYLHAAFMFSEYFKNFIHRINGAGDLEEETWFLFLNRRPQPNHTERR
jgi:hypothetical protein